MRYDKQKAKKGEWRVSELTLFVIAALGGSVGILFGMRMFRHKTKKVKFFIGIPLIIIIQAVALAKLIPFLESLII
jgi:uncharacterized membrane protein YsdA (DUF1294 family)